MASPQCLKYNQKFKTAQSDSAKDSGTDAPASDSVDVSCKVFSKKTLSPTVGPSVTPPITKPTIVAEDGKILMSSLLSKLSFSTKKTISAHLTEYLMRMGREDLSNDELQEFVMKMVFPFLPNVSHNCQTSSKNSVPVSRPPTHSEPPKKKSSCSNSESETVSPQKQNGKAVTTVKSSRVVGSALPSLPTYL